MKFMVFLSLVAVTLADFHNPDENENAKSPFLVEGDLRISPQSRGSIPKHKLWRNGVVPYTFSPTFARNRKAVSVTLEAMRQWATATCVKFVKRTTQRNYVQLVIERGCWSYLGTTGGMQKISLGPGCQIVGIAAHELGHALGFYHEQSRPDRDSYVRIIERNIRQGYAYAFRKHTIDTHGTPYDYGSVMHYGPYAFSKNRRATIVATKSGFWNLDLRHNKTLDELRVHAKATFGQRRGPSATDFDEMKKLYSCGGSPTVCSDKNRKCISWTWYCTQPAYRRFMYLNCKRTCGFCRG